MYKDEHELYWEPFWICKVTEDYTLFLVEENKTYAFLNSIFQNRCFGASDPFCMFGDTLYRHQAVMASEPPHKAFPALFGSSELTNCSRGNTALFRSFDYVG
ncbi:hypothetical protein Y1Q_0015665 [Alligator mississippiensis]|uniref:Uncharacterized protein n=1 Tax=Alligator mississippiensis TaxID=8496 RepID=A0A151NNY2_ALLMI|nr:hypothetical protein Y1Q_0015665 [Alligator mississippiensis]